MILISLSNLTVFAHSGGTDSAGGHYNRSTGEYHYHHGYPAHQHPNGVCPYSTTSARTTRSYNQSSVTTTKTETTTTRITERANNTTTNKNSDNESSTMSLGTAILYMIVLGFLAPFSVIYTIYNLIHDRKKTR